MNLRHVLIHEGDKFMAAHQREYDQRVREEAEWNAKFIPWKPYPDEEEEQHVKDRCTALIQALAEYVNKNPGVIDWGKEYGDAPCRLSLVLPESLHPKDSDYSTWREMIETQGLYYDSDANEIKWVVDPPPNPV